MLNLFHYKRRNDLNTLARKTRKTFGNADTINQNFIKITTFKLLNQKRVGRRKIISHSNLNH